MKMVDDASCKGCRAEYKVDEAHIARILALPMFASEHCVTEEVYNQRLELCRSCSKLQGEMTCSVCGCIVPVAAKLKDKSCPLPGSGRWGKAI